MRTIDVIATEAKVRHTHASALVLVPVSSIFEICSNAVEIVRFYALVCISASFDFIQFMRPKTSLNRHDFYGA